MLPFSHFSKLKSIMALALGPESERDIGMKWLLRTHTPLYRRFLRDHRIRIERTEEFTHVFVDEKPFAWPPRASVERLTHLLCELLVDGHPHQYNYQWTKFRANEVVLDIGCCEGGFAALAAETGARVIAVEPSEQMGKVIRRLFALRSLPAPEIQRCLLGVKPGTAYYRDDEEDPARSCISDRQIPNSYPLPVRTIDELVSTLPEKPTFLKCDAEGADLSILEGGHEFLKQCRPRIAVTTYHHRSDFRQIGEYLRSLGYRVHGKGCIFITGDLRISMIHAL